MTESEYEHRKELLREALAQGSVKFASDWRESEIAAAVLHLINKDLDENHWLWIPCREIGWGNE